MRLSREAGPGLPTWITEEEVVLRTCANLFVGAAGGVDSRLPRSPRRYGRA
jgi:hypothetical protein